MCGYHVMAFAAAYIEVLEPGYFQSQLGYSLDYDLADLRTVLMGKKQQTPTIRRVDNWAQK